MLARFPHPVQKLILEEYREVERDGGVTLRELGDDITCRCLFYRQWQLPCRHIILQEKVFGGVLTDSYWDNWYRKWDESGFELYEGMTADYMNGPVDEEIGAPRRILVDATAVFEELKTRLYMFHENTKYWPREQQNEAWASWLDDFQKVTGPLRREGFEQFQARLSSESQTIVEETQVQMKCVEPLGVDFRYYKDGDELIDLEEWEG